MAYFSTNSISALKKALFHDDEMERNSTTIACINWRSSYIWDILPLGITWMYNVDMFQICYEASGKGPCVSVQASVSLLEYRYVVTTASCACLTMSIMFMIGNFKWYLRRYESYRILMHQCSKSLRTISDTIWQVNKFCPCTYYLSL